MMTEEENMYDLLSDIMMKVLELEDDSEYKRFSSYPQYQFDWLISCSGLEHVMLNVLFKWGNVCEEKVRHMLVLCRKT